MKHGRPHRNMWHFGASWLSPPNIHDSNINLRRGTSNFEECDDRIAIWPLNTPIRSQTACLYKSIVEHRQNPIWHSHIRGIIQLYIPVVKIVSYKVTVASYLIVRNMGYTF